MPSRLAASPQGDGTAAHALMRAFIALLEREQQLLAQPQAEALQAIAAEKQALAQKLHACSTRCARTVGAPVDAEMSVLTKRARALNTINAKLLAMQRSCCESRLNLLRGRDAADTLYRANGYLTHQH